MCKQYKYDKFNVKSLYILNRRHSQKETSHCTDLQTYIMLERNGFNFSNTKEENNRVVYMNRSPVKDEILYVLNSITKENTTFDIKNS